jgi:hypothetical protein
MVDLVETFDKLRLEYPTMSASALIAAGIGIGCTVGWLWWKQQNSHLKQVNEHLKDALAEKVPVGSIAHLLKTPGRRPKLGPAIVAICLVGVAIGAVIWYVQSGTASSVVPTVVHDPPTDEQIKTAAVPPKTYSYPDKAQAKEALSNLHEVLIRKVQPSIKDSINFDRAPRTLNLTISARGTLSQMPGQPRQPFDMKAETTAVIKEFLNTQISQFESLTTSINEAWASISEVKNKQRALTAVATEDFFKLTDRSSTFDVAKEHCISGLRYFANQEIVDFGIFPFLKDRCDILEKERVALLSKLSDAAQRIAAEVAAIGDK